MLVALIILAAIVLCALGGMRVWYIAGHADGYCEGVREGSRRYAQTIGAVNATLRDMSAAQFSEIIRSNSIDVVGGILKCGKVNADKAELDAKARVAEWMQ